MCKRALWCGSKLDNVLQVDPEEWAGVLIEGP